ncbi:MAG: tetratricopeptide repeat protein [Pirellulales bacterium]|nr:tetratricopeptide repeat protein [Pirellulales bacterium]
MRAILPRTILGLTIASLALAVPSLAQTLLPPGGAGDSTAKKPPQMQEIDDAISFFKNGDLENAEKKFEEAVAKNPDLPPAPLLMAQLCSQAQQGQLVLMYLEKAVQKSPEDPEAYLQLGEIDLNQRRVAGADLLFMKAAELLKKFNKSAERKNAMMPRASSDQAAVSELREDWPTAQQRLEECLKLDPKNAIVMQRVARSLFQQKKAQEAFEKLKQAKQADDKVLTPELILAKLYLGFNDPTNAKKWTAEGLKNASKDLSTRLEAARIYVQTGQQGDLDEAKTQAAKALELDSKSLDALMLRGVIGLFQKDYAGAVSYFEQAAMMSPSAFPATNNLALALVELKDESKKKRALEYAVENVRKIQGTQNQQNAQNVAEALSTLGWVLYRIDPVKNLDEADKQLRQAVGTNAYNPDTLYYAAVVGLANKRSEEAKRFLNQALKTTAPWTMKTEAKSLLEQLNKN